MRRLKAEGEQFAITKADLATGVPGTSLVDQIFAVVETAIQNRRLATGVRMPSVRQLAVACCISRDTAARAYDKLVAQGLLEPRRGAGFYVKAFKIRKHPDRDAMRPAPFYSQLVDNAFRLKMTLINPYDTLKTRSGAGYLPATWIDEGQISSAMRAVARSMRPELDRPGSSQGHLPLREQIKLKLEDLGIHADPSNIIATSGATDALSLVIQRMLTVGEFVLVEQPTQPLLIERLMASGCDFAYVPRLADGPDLATLRALCVQRAPRLFFCSTVLHNPTSRHIAAHVAFQLLRLAEEFDLTIIEDDTYGDLLPPTTAVTRLASMDQLQRTVYVGSFSKTLPPSLRVGFLAAHPKLTEWLSVYRAFNCIATNSMAENTVYRLLTEGYYRHHCEQLRIRLSDLRPRVIQALREFGVIIDSEPDSGLFIWGNLGREVNAFTISQKLLEQGHLSAPGQIFSYDHLAYMRFNIAETLNNEFLPALRRVLEAHAP